MGDNMFIAEFVTQRDRDHVWDGSPWHISKNAVILSEFKDCMKPSELCFDKLQLWPCVIYLPFNLREKKWWKIISGQIDKQAKDVEFDHVGAFLRARVTVDIANPLRICILINSARRQCVDMYEVQYEQIPHFCFSCGRLGHSDMLCPTPGTRAANGDLSFGKGLRALDDQKRSSYSEGSSGDYGYNQQNKADARNSSTVAREPGPEAMSPLKNKANKRIAAGQNKVYRRVEKPLLLTAPTDDVANHSLVLVQGPSPMATEVVNDVDGVEQVPKKKKPTPTNSGNLAAAASQPCLDQ
jgi:hypothetical protein